MKRVIRDNEDVSIRAGIYLDDSDNIKFNWNADTDDDILQLVYDLGGKFDSNNIRYIYGYTFNPKANSEDKRIVRNYLKNLHAKVFDEDIDDFVEDGVCKLCRYTDDGKFFKAIVDVESASHKDVSLTDIMFLHIHENIKTLSLSFHLIKKMYKDIVFDEDKARVALSKRGKANSEVERTIWEISDKFETLKASGKLFQMKRFVPKEIRDSFSDYLQFETDEDRILYQTLRGDENSGCNVLVYNDFYISGSTVREIARYLHSINPLNTVTVFILVKQ